MTTITASPQLTTGSVSSDAVRVIREDESRQRLLVVRDTIQDTITNVGHHHREFDGLVVARNLVDGMIADLAVTVEAPAETEPREHDWERTNLNGDGGSGDLYEWACTRCDRRQWNDTMDGPQDAEHDCQ